MVAWFLRLKDVLSWLLVEENHASITVDMNVIALCRQETGSSIGRNVGQQKGSDSSWKNIQNAFSYTLLGRTSSNLRNQATIQDGRVTPQQVQGRQSQNVAGIRSKEKILLGNDVDVKKMLVDTTAFDNENDDIGTSYDSDMVSENNSDITSVILNMDPDRGKEEHDDVNYEKQCAFFAFLINNLKCDVEKCNEVNREAQQANALLTNQLERYKEKEKHFAKDMAIEYAYCK
nr:hypothetical protein [Tanacetum cinerariifolium]